MGYPSASVGALTDVHSTQQNPLGQRRFEGVNEYIYLQGVASTAQYDLVTFDEAFATTRAVAAAVGPCAIAQAAIVASSYGWYLINGSGTLNCSAAVADNAKLFLTATAGQVDDTSVAGDQVVGAIARSSAAGAGTITAQVRYPQVGVNVA